MIYTFLRSWVAAALLLAAATAFASDDHAASHATPPAASSAVASAAGTETDALNDLAEGEVRKIDAANKKLTLRHGEIKRISMPPMTMVFRVSDAALLDGIKVGDKVRFAAEKEGGGIVVTQLHPAQ